MASPSPGPMMVGVANRQTEIDLTDGSAAVDADEDAALFVALAFAALQEEDAVPGEGDDYHKALLIALVPVVGVVASLLTLGLLCLLALRVRTCRALAPVRVAPMYKVDLHAQPTLKV